MFTWTILTERWRSICSYVYYLHFNKHKCGDPLLNHHRCMPPDGRSDANLYSLHPVQGLRLVFRLMLEWKSTYCDEFYQSTANYLVGWQSRNEGRQGYRFGSNSTLWRASSRYMSLDHHPNLSFDFVATVINAVWATARNASCENRVVSIHPNENTLNELAPYV